MIVLVHHPDGTTRTVRGDAVLDGGEVPPGFSLPLREGFRLPGA